MPLPHTPPSRPSSLRAATMSDLSADLTAHSSVQNDLLTAAETVGLEKRLRPEVSGRCLRWMRAKRQIQLIFMSSLRHQRLSQSPQPLLLHAAQELGLTIPILHRRKLREVKLTLRATQPASGCTRASEAGLRCGWLW